jgi:hypothetical protein
VVDLRSSQRPEHRTPAGAAVQIRAAVVSSFPSLPKHRSSPRWITHAALNLPDPSSSSFDPRSTEIAQLQRTSAAGAVSGEQSPPPRAPNPASRPIRSQRSRLDPNPSRVGALRSRSGGPDSPIPVRLRFKSEPSFWNPAVGNGSRVDRVRSVGSRSNG